MPTLFPQTLASEFPDYPIISLPDLEGWENTSWRNDPCPSFRRNDFLVWIDYPDPREREDFDGRRFILCRLDKEGQLPADDSTLLETDDWAEVVALVNWERLGWTVEASATSNLPGHFCPIWRQHPVG